MTHSRRTIVKAGLLTAGLWITGQNAFAEEKADKADKPAKKKRKRIPVGVQLYSVREDCKKDLPGVLKAIGKMGYNGVEFAGYYDHKAEDLRKLLDENKLKCCGTHTAIETLLPENFDKTVEFNKIIGNKFLIVPSLPAQYTSSQAALRDTGKLFTELAEKAKKHGMRVGYHAHAGDFKVVDGKAAWEIIFDAASPDVVMQLDTSNCLAGGGDPIAILKKYPGRAVTIHLKEHGGKPGAVIGEGEVKWKEVFELCDKAGTTEWYIVEQEAYGDKPPLDSIKACLENVRKMRKEAPQA